MNEYQVHYYMMNRSAYVIAANKFQAAEMGRYELTGQKGKVVYFEGAMMNEAVFEDGSVYVVEVTA